jgi:hypothetical protein
MGEFVDITNGSFLVCHDILRGHEIVERGPETGGREDE